MQMAAAGERTLDIDGSAVHYLEAGTGAPLLLVHGLGHSSTAWRRTIPGLSADRRVLAPDLPGFGRSPLPANAVDDDSYGVPAGRASLGIPQGDPLYGDPAYFANVIGHFIAATASGPIDAVGHSAGGLSLLLLAQREPAKFRRLVLVDPAGFSKTPSATFAFVVAGIAGALLRAARSRRLRRALYATAFYDARRVDEETVDELLARERSTTARRAVRDAFERFYAFCKHPQALHEALRDFAVPTQIIWGSDDRLFRVSATETARRVLPQARIEVFERCGHCPHIECPERFVAAVKEFLTSP